MRKLIWSALAATCLLAAGSSARAQDDTFRLGGPSAQADIEGGTDTELVYYRGGFRGGYGRGFYGGFYGGRGYGGWGRGYYGGGWGRGYYGGGWGRGYGLSVGWGRGYYGGWGRGYYGGWGGGYYSPYYYTSYYSSPAYYYTPTYYSQPYCSDYYYGISGDTAPVLTLQATSNGNGIAGLSQRLLPFSSDGTYPYNGGPESVIPMPAGPINKLQPGSLPVDGKLVTLPTETRGGFSPVTSPDIQRLRYVTTPAVPATPAAPIRVKYPAYGEK